MRSGASCHDILISAWISNHMYSKVLDDFTYLFINVNKGTVQFFLDSMNDFITHFIMDVIVYLCGD